MLQQHPLEPAPTSIKNNFPLVFIVIVNYRNPELTLSSVQSLYALTYPNFQICVVDNGSGDDSLDVLHRAADIHLLASDENLGFSRGCNLGIDFALSRCTDYVWLLNSDALATTNALTELVRIGEATGGLVGSKLYYLDPENKRKHPEDFDLENARYQTVGIRYNFWTANFRTIPESDLSRPKLNIDGLPGASLLIPRQVIQTVGKMDESYFLYFEDAEYTIRARHAGFPTSVARESLVLHQMGASTGGRRNKTTYYYIWRNRYKMGFRFGNPLQKFSLLVLAYCRLSQRFLKAIFNKPQRAYFHRQYLKLEWLAFSHFLSGVNGPCPAGCLDGVDWSVND